MPFTYRRRARATPRTTTTTRPRRSIFPRRRVHHTHHTTHTTHTTHAPVHHQKRRPSFKDKVSGALLRMKGSLTHRPAVKAAGTRRMHGTDGRGSHRPRRRMF
ncbi:hypothetical protein V2G26_008590 [Clonostachys chloroleuca]|uniref:Uncharacterized protein n=1 Tax=Clonostachys chloroleuca TaxID=1926264 RepID=A0AA35QDR0_9HYPO|nr:unnamed protein product [Clonostachys chloroleuca]